MFVSDFLFVERPWQEIAGAITNMSTDAWSESGILAAISGHELTLAIGPSQSASILRKRVRIFAEPPRTTDRAVVIPLHWAATRVPWLFPTMDADLEISPLSEDRSRVAISGMYQPPLGVAGRTADALALHHVAEATVRALLTRMANATMASRDGGKGSP